MREEIAALLQKAEESIRAAELLLKEGLFAIAVSRAYYAMFYVAEALLLKEGVELSKHGAVVAVFGERFAKTGRLDPKFHQYLIEGLEERQAADYDAPAEFSREDAEKQVERAREFLSVAKRSSG